MGYNWTGLNFLIQNTWAQYSGRKLSLTSQKGPPHYVCCASLFFVRARERKRESKREREKEKCLEAEKMKENENPETLKCMRGFFFFNRKGWVEFGYIVFGLNGGSMGF